MSNDVALPGTGAIVETIDQGGTGTTNSTTAAGNATLHFAATPAFVAVGMGISDTTAPTVIPSGTTVISFTGTTVVMSVNATGAGVGGTDTIVFTAQRQVTHIGSQASQGFTSPATITRPANTTAYTANDNIGGAITFANAAPSGGGDILINSAELEADIAAIPAGATSYRLYLYTVTPPSALADNTAWDLPSGDRASFLGYVDLGLIADLGSTLYCRVDGLATQIKAASSSVFGYLVTNGGFTPAANSEVYKVTLHATAL